MQGLRSGLSLLLTAPSSVASSSCFATTGFCLSSGSLQDGVWALFSTIFNSIFIPKCCLLGLLGFKLCTPWANPIPSTQFYCIRCCRLPHLCKRKTGLFHGCFFPALNVFLLTGLLVCSYLACKTQFQYHHFLGTFLAHPQRGYVFLVLLSHRTYCNCCDCWSRHLFLLLVWGCTRQGTCLLIFISPALNTTSSMKTVLKWCLLNSWIN